MNKKISYDPRHELTIPLLYITSKEIAKFSKLFYKAMLLFHHWLQHTFES